MGYGEGKYGLGGYGIEDQELVTIYVFEPPTHEEPIRTTELPLSYYRLTYANSIVRINGQFVSIRTPAFELLTGQQGVDWFRGGYVYVVDPVTRDELIAAGFNVRVITGLAEDLAGYGLGPYGSGTYGD